MQQENIFNIIWRILVEMIERCICKFKMIGIMTESPREATIHNRNCPVHKITLVEQCKCKQETWTGKDAFENVVNYKTRNTTGCKIHNKDKEDWFGYYPQIPHASHYLGEVDRREKKDE
jgi:hypothetical protein